MKSDKKWINRALRLAQRGFYGASPNPYVGCVIVKNGRNVAEGAHLEFGGPHAEVQALKRAGAKARGATLYCNLEPCRHWGKTPPCTEAIIRAGIKKVVASMADPNPLVRGKGFKDLKRAGIMVETGACEKEAGDLNRSFIKFTRENKPYVFVKAAVSLDGKTSTRTGDSKWISSRESRDYAHRVRAQMDGILVGAETVRRDNPSLTSHGKGRNPVRIVLTRSGRLPLKAKIFNGRAPAWVFKRQPLGKMLRTLAQKGISRLLVEGGGKTAAEFIRAGEADEFLFFVAPIWIGGASKVKDALTARKLTARKIGPDILIRGRVEK